MVEIKKEFFENVNKIDKFLTRLTMKKQKRHKSETNQEILPQIVQTGKE